MSETEPSASRNPPSRRRLNDRFVKTVRPEAKRKLHWDTIQQGLALCVEPTGHKSYKLIYTFHGRPRWYTIGKTSHIDLRGARKIARDKMADVTKGIDVQAEKMAGRRAGTFEELADRYLNEHAKLRNKSWAPTRLRQP